MFLYLHLYSRVYAVGLPFEGLYPLTDVGYGLTHLLYTP